MYLKDKEREKKTQRDYSLASSPVTATEGADQTKIRSPELNFSLPVGMIGTQILVLSATVSEGTYWQELGQQQKRWHVNQALPLGMASQTEKTCCLICSPHKVECFKSLGTEVTV